MKYSMLKIIRNLAIWINGTRAEMCIRQKPEMVRLNRLPAAILFLLFGWALDAAVGAEYAAVPSFGA